MSSVQSKVATWSIRKRLIAGLTTLAVITGLVGALGIWGFFRVNSALQGTIRQDLPAVIELLELDRDVQQAVIAERSLMFMSASTPAAEEQFKLLRRHLAGVAEHWQAYTRLPASDAERDRRSGFESHRAQWEDASREVAKLLAQDTPADRRDAIDLSMGQGKSSVDQARAALALLTEQRLGQMRAHAASTQAAATRIGLWIVLAVTTAFAAAILLGWMLTAWVVRPLRQVVALLRDIAEGAGDLTRRLTVVRHDEVGELAQWFNVFVAKLHDIVGEVRRTAVHVAGAAQDMSSGTEQLSAGAQEQAGSLEETAASLEEITGTVRQNADGARQANQLAVGARTTAEEGGQVVAAAVSAMAEISRASKQIAEIVTTIDEIAFQTNLLALNAAVEAARAGEQGRGFAVVAAEVRSLAQRCATAAREIRHLIQDSAQKVETGADLVNRSGHTLEEIVAAVKRTTDIIGEISAASQEQAQGIEQVNRAVGQMDQGVQANAAQTEELSASSSALAEHATQLRTLVERFKLAEADTAPPPVVPPMATEDARPAAGRLARLAAATRPTPTMRPAPAMPVSTVG